jgi:16S rRNA processing protein RimM
LGQSLVQDTHILVGKIQGVFGIKGWLKVFSYCRPKEQIFDYTHWDLSLPKSTETFELQEGKIHGNGIIAKLKHLDDRTRAETYLGAEIWVNKSALHQLADDEFYWFELEGMNVKTIDGDTLGKVVRLMETGANDVLVVQSDNNQEEILIPYLREQVIKQVELETKTITVDWQKDY